MIVEKRIQVIAITGGPCGGKSTFLAKAHDLLADGLLQIVRRGVDELGGVELPEHLIALLQDAQSSGAEVLHSAEP